MTHPFEEPPGKREALERLLHHGDVLLQLDPRVDGVQVPAGFTDQPLLVLRIGLDMPVPIPDLEIDAGGVSATLSFNRQPHACRIPWDAVFGMVSESGQALVWAEDVPYEVVERLAQRLATSGPLSVALPEPLRSPRLVALDGGRLGAAPEPDDHSQGPPPLRLVD